MIPEGMKFEKLVAALMPLAATVLLGYYWDAFLVESQRIGTVPLSSMGLWDL